MGRIDETEFWETGLVLGRKVKFTEFIRDDILSVKKSHRKKKVFPLGTENDEECRGTC